MGRYRQARGAGNHTLFDGEFHVGVWTGPDAWPSYRTHPGEVWLYQMTGGSRIEVMGSSGPSSSPADNDLKVNQLSEGDVMLLPSNSTFKATVSGGFTKSPSVAGLVGRIGLLDAINE